jgi:hypothetical protein
VTSHGTLRRFVARTIAKLAKIVRLTNGTSLMKVTLSRAKMIDASAVPRRIAPRTSRSRASGRARTGLNRQSQVEIRSATNEKPIGRHTSQPHRSARYWCCSPAPGDGRLSGDSPPTRRTIVENACSETAE